jgi:hypothetical protein
MTASSQDTTTIKTATGLTVSCRHILGDDAEELYRREKKRKDIDIATFLLNRCVVGVDDPGIYGEKFRTVHDFKKVLSGDRFHLLMRLRAFSIADDYRFSVQCRSCGEPIRWEVNISELPILEPMPGHLEKLMAGEREFEDEVDGYGPVRVVYADGEIEEKIKNDVERQGHSWPMATILNRVVSVGDVSGKGDLFDLVKRARATLFDDLFALCGKHDFGLDLVIGVKCQRVGCGAFGEAVLPFDLRFLLPRSAKTSS